MDVVEVYVYIDFVGRVSGGAGERKHKVRDDTCPRVFRLSCAMRRA